MLGVTGQEAGVQASLHSGILLTGPSEAAENMTKGRDHAAGRPCRSAILLSCGMARGRTFGPIYLWIWALGRIRPN